MLLICHFIDRVDILTRVEKGDKDYKFMLIRNINKAYLGNQVICNFIEIYIYKKYEDKKRSCL